MKLKVLSINRKLSNDEIVRGTLEDSPSISDFDALVIDPRYVLPGLYQSPTLRMPDGSFFTNFKNDSGHGKRIISLIDRRKKETESLLTITQGLVICYLRKKQEPLSILTVSGIRNIANYSWLPDYSTIIEGSRPTTFVLSEYINFQESTGTEVSIVDQRHPFFQFFKAFKKDIEFECTFGIGKTLLPFVRVLAQNKVNEVLSCEISIGGGRLIFLPTLKFWEPEKETGVLLNCIKGMAGRGYVSPPPPWIKDYVLPGEAEHEPDIERLAREIGLLEKRKHEFEDKRESLSRFKGLLYEKGKIILEGLVREAFRLLGFEVLEPEAYPGDEEYDLYIRGSDLSIIGEIEGTDSSMIDLEKVRQLLDYVVQETGKGIKTKGILIGNSRRGIDPAQREAQFTIAAIELAERLSYCLLTSCQLFELVKKVLSGISPGDVLKIRQSILSCEGEYKLI